MELVTHPCYRCDGATCEPVVGRTAECVWCGAFVTLPRAFRPKPKPAPAGGTVRLESGRHAGRTLAEIDAEPNGRRYLLWLRSRASPLSEAVDFYLENNSAPPRASVVAETTTAAAKPGEA